MTIIIIIIVVIIVFVVAGIITIINNNCRTVDNHGRKTFKPAEVLQYL